MANKKRDRMRLHDILIFINFRNDDLPGTGGYGGKMGWSFELIYQCHAPLNYVIHFFSIRQRYISCLTFLFTVSRPCKAGIFSVSRLECRLNARQGILFGIKQSRVQKSTSSMNQNMIEIHSAKCIQFFNFYHLGGMIN